jgi:hypothetical protein
MVNPGVIIEEIKEASLNSIQFLKMYVLVT